MHLKLKTDIAQFGIKFNDRVYILVQFYLNSLGKKEGFASSLV